MVQLTFHSMDVEASDDCNTDFVSVRAIGLYVIAYFGFVNIVSVFPS